MKLIDEGIEKLRYKKVRQRHWAPHEHFLIVAQTGIGFYGKNQDAVTVSWLGDGDFWEYCDEVQPNTSKEGTKLDTGKVGLHLVPFTALIEVGKVLDFGAQKYEPWNWAKGMAWSRLLGAAFRHLFKWAVGIDKDEETGLSHLAHAACCILFLLDYTNHNVGTDDRFKWKNTEERP